MKLKVIIEKGEDGYFAAHCPSLRSCWSQGKTKAEALKNIQEAIELYLEPDIKNFSENSSNKLMGNSHDSLSKGQAVLFSFKEIRLKEGIATDNVDSHKIDNSPEMAVVSFRDSACSLKLAGLKDGRVNSCVGNKRLMRGERILGYINTDEQFKQSNTSIKSYSDKAGEASRPILYDDKGSETQSTYYGFGRQGTDSFEGSLIQVIWSSPACPTLTGKTRLYKSYNTNS